jgi:hypothetical protein
MAANAAGVQTVDGLTKSRLLQIVGRNLTSEAARIVARDLVAGAAIDESEREDLFTSATGAFLGSKIDRNLDEVHELNWERLNRAFLEKIVERCASRTWDIANPAIHLIQNTSNSELQCLERETLAKYVLNVASVGLGDFKSKQASTLVLNGIGARMDAIDALAGWVNEDPASVFACQTDWEAVVMILDRSKRKDVIAPLFSAMAVHMETPSKVCKYLEIHLDKELADLGATLRIKAEEFEED